MSALFQSKPMGMSERHRRWQEEDIDMTKRCDYFYDGVSSVVRHERDPLSGWMMAFLVLVILVGLGFMSLMDLSSQLARTERSLFEVKQELRLMHRASAQMEAVTEKPVAITRSAVYSELNNLSPSGDSSR